MATKEMDSTVQMRLYTLTKRQFVLVFVSFFVAFFLTVIIGIAGPRIIVEHTQSASNLHVPSGKLSTGPFQIDTGILSTFNQQLWLLCQIKLNGTKAGASFSDSFHLSVKIYGRAKDSSYHLIAETPFNRTRQLQCQKLIFIVYGPVHTAVNTFEDGECNPLVILHLGYLDYPSYVATVNFHGLQFPKGIDIRDIDFVCMFAHSLRRFPLREWSIEQKWMSLLLPLLLLYNDPLFPLNFLVNSWVPGMFDSVFQASFLCGLLLFWLCAFHGIRQYGRGDFSIAENFEMSSERSDAAVSERKLSFYLPKVLIVGLLWIASFTLSSWQQYNELQDPTYQYKIDIGHFMGLKVMFFTIGAIYLVYLIYLLFRAYSELRAMPYFESYFRDQSTFSMLNESEDEDALIYNSQREKATFSSSEEET
ncbi:hypothetical protein pdam_00004582 [Pocillopora damicornis]|uniref:Transmembrane protein 181 n=1 Tax=Pocillopora damicornis TaxID=46731 RepID=A0A3M6UMI5_POCDA|nr:hypothetical protein pdam_00004582 [Pocillopora damicornis]